MHRKVAGEFLLNNDVNAIKIAVSDIVYDRYKVSY